MNYSLPMPGLGFGFPNVTGPAQPIINQGLRSAAAIGVNVVGATAAFTVVFGAVDMELQRRSAEDYFRRNGHYPGDLPNNYVEANGQAGSNGQTPATASSSPQRPAASYYLPPLNTATGTAPPIQSYEQMQAQWEQDLLQREQADVTRAVNVAHQYPLTLARLTDKPASLEAMTLRSGESSWDATERVMASFVQEAMDFNGNDANRRQGLRMIAFERTLPNQFARVPSRVVGTAEQLAKWLDPLRQDARGNYALPLLNTWDFRQSGVDPSWVRDSQVSQISTDGPVRTSMIPGTVGDPNAGHTIPDGAAGTLTGNGSPSPPPPMLFAPIPGEPAPAPVPITPELRQSAPLRGERHNISPSNPRSLRGAINNGQVMTAAADGSVETTQNPSTVGVSTAPQEQNAREQTRIITTELEALIANDSKQRVASAFNAEERARLIAQAILNAWTEGKLLAGNELSYFAIDNASITVFGESPDSGLCTAVIQLLPSEMITRQANNRNTIEPYTPDLTFPTIFPIPTGAAESRTNGLSLLRPLTEDQRTALTTMAQGLTPEELAEEVTPTPEQVAALKQLFETVPITTEALLIELANFSSQAKGRAFEGVVELMLKELFTFTEFLYTGNTNHSGDFIGTLEGAQQRLMIEAKCYDRTTISKELEKLEYDMNTEKLETALFVTTLPLGRDGWPEGAIFQFPQDTASVHYVRFDAWQANPTQTSSDAGDKKLIIIMDAADIDAYLETKRAEIIESYLNDPIMMTYYTEAIYMPLRNYFANLNPTLLDGIAPDSPDEIIITPGEQPTAEQPN